MAKASRLVAIDKTNDLALLKVEATPPAVASYRTGVRIGEALSVFGFPLAGLLASTGNFTVGNVTATAGLRDDTRMFQISAPVQPGNSGGPMLDQSGNVVGVIVSKLDALKYATALKDVPQNINFAIKASVAASFLKANNIDWSREGATTSLPPADVAERAKSITVHIICR